MCLGKIILSDGKNTKKKKIIAIQENENKKFSNIKIAEKQQKSPQPRFELGSKASEALILSIELPGQIECCEDYTL